MSHGVLFSGQGAQKVGMGKSLCEAFPVARSLFDQANLVLGWDLSKICFEGPENELTQTKVCQPALFVHGYALYSILQERGRFSDLKVALGLSLGEITALTAAGVFDFATGLKVVAERGRLMQLACEATQGTMAAIIGEDKSAVLALCQEFEIDMANLNAPGQIIVSGEVLKVGAAVEAAKARGMKKVVPLNVAGAYHSRLMEPARAAFAEFLKTVPFAPPRIAVLTNTTGKAVSQADEIREALVKQVVSSVLWADCMETASGLGATEFIECGPGGVLAGLAKRINKSLQVTSVAEQPDLAAIGVS